MNLNINDYLHVISCTSEANQKKTFVERYQVLRPNVFPFQRTLAHTLLEAGTYLEHDVTTGLFLDQKEPKIVGFFSRTLYCFGYGIMGFSRHLEEDILRRTRRLATSRWSEADRVFLDCGYSPSRPDSWESFPFTLHDEKLELLFAGNFEHGHHSENGNGWRRITYPSGEPYRDQRGGYCESLRRLIVFEIVKREGLMSHFQTVSQLLSFGIPHP